MFVGKPTPRDGEPWALDNGAFGAWKSGRPWRESSFSAALDHARSAHPPLFAVLPDVVGDGRASLLKSTAYLSAAPSHVPWFLAVQDGMTESDVRTVIKDVDGLFLGGTDAFKATARRWCGMAHEHGKRFHFARVSTETRLRAALDMGADSADTSQPLWSRAEWARFERCWRDAHAQRSFDWDRAQP